MSLPSRSDLHSAFLDGGILNAITVSISQHFQFYHIIDLTGLNYSL